MNCMEESTDAPDRDTKVPMTLDLAQRVERLLNVERPRYRRLWAYCRNPMRVGTAVDPSGSEKPYVQAQEWGLPPRITGIKSGGDVFEGELIEGFSRKEVVVENDIGWRVDTMVDYLFGKPLVIESTAPDPDRRRIIGELLRLILGHNGGILLLQQLALLGSVYGFVDVLVKLQPRCDDAQDTAGVCGTAALGQPPSGERSGEGSAGSPGAAQPAGTVDPADAAQRDDAGPAPEADHREGPPVLDHPDRTRNATDASPEALKLTLERLARMVRIEIVEPARALPFLSCEDWKSVQGYAQVWEVRREGSGVGAQGSGSEGPRHLFLNSEP